MRMEYSENTESLMTDSGSFWLNNSMVIVREPKPAPGTTGTDFQFESQNESEILLRLLEHRTHSSIKHSLDITALNKGL